MCKPFLGSKLKVKSSKLKVQNSKFKIQKAEIGLPLQQPKSGKDRHSLPNPKSPIDIENQSRLVNADAINAKRLKHTQISFSARSGQATK
jgi:hypothetical protein